MDVGTSVEVVVGVGVNVGGCVAVGGSGVGGVSPGRGVAVAVAVEVGVGDGVGDAVGTAVGVLVGANVGRCVAVSVGSEALGAAPSCIESTPLPMTVHSSTLTMLSPMAICLASAERLVLSCVSWAPLSMPIVSYGGAMRDHAVVLSRDRCLFQAKGDRKVERGAFAHSALDPDVSLVRFDERSDDR